MDLYDVSQFKGSYACQKGCHTCCTQDVTITGLEGDLILQYLEENNKNLPLPNPDACAKKPTLTTNDYVQQFIDKCPEPLSGMAEDYSRACPFLTNGQCSIYPARPYMCRGFMSIHNCMTQGFADVPPQIPAFNTVMQQVIEHLSAGRPWGLLTDVLRVIADQKEIEGTQKLTTSRLLTCRKAPGFLLTSAEKRQLRKMLKKVHLVIGKHPLHRQEINTLPSFF